MNPYKKMQASAAKRLLVAVIKQAVEDYRAFEKRGLIANGRVIRPARRGPFVERDECRSLVKFFCPGGAMDHLITVGGLGVHGDAIRERLGMATNAE